METLFHMQKETLNDDLLILLEATKSNKKEAGRNPEKPISSLGK